jgi:hypothetical protein
MNSLEQKSVRIRSFAVALFNVGLGFEPVVETDASGKFVYVFPPAVKDARDRYFAAKDLLAALQHDCLRRSTRGEDGA